MTKDELLERIAAGGIDGIDYGTEGLLGNALGSLLAEEYVDFSDAPGRVRLSCKEFARRIVSRRYPAAYAAGAPGVEKLAATIIDVLQGKPAVPT